MAFSFPGFLKGLLIQNETDRTKQVIIQSSSASTTGTSTTITTAQTANRVLTLPDATDTVVGRVTTDTLSNKTLDNTNTATIKSNHFTLQDSTDTTKQAIFDLSGLPTSTTQTIVVNAGAAVTTAGVQTLSNKTLDNTTIEFIKDNNFTLEHSSDTTRRATFDLSNISTGVTANYALPAPGGGNLISQQSTDLLRNKSLVDNSTSIVDNADNTKQILFNAGGTTGTSTTLTAAQTANRILTLPDATDTLVARNTTEFLNNKFLVDNTTVISNNTDSTKQIHFAANGTTNTTTTIQSSQTTGRTIILPDASDTLVGKATTDTLTNKTMGDALTFSQIATPSNPSSGFDKVYVKSDNNLYILNSSGVETAVGGSTPINASYVSQASGTVANGATAAFIKFATQKYDTNSAYNTSTGIYTIPATGKYHITAQTFQTGNSGNSGYMFMWLDINGTRSYIGQNAGAFNSGLTSSCTVSITITLLLTLNDQIKFEVVNETAQTMTFGSPDNQGTYFQIEKIG